MKHKKVESKKKSRKEEMRDGKHAHGMKPKMDMKSKMKMKGCK